MPSIGELQDTIQIDAKSHPDVAFALRVRGESMVGAGINDGDTLLFASPTTREPKPGDVVACRIDDEVTIKTFLKQNGKSTLRAANPAYPDPVVTKNSAIQGVMIGRL